MKLLLVGNPNVGKTTVFNALTGAHLRTGNFHGVTVDVAEHPLKGEQSIVVCDLPGVYAPEGSGKEEKIAYAYLEKCRKENAVLVQVVDLRYLTRSLRLTQTLSRFGLPIFIVFTMRSRFERAGGFFDPERFTAQTGFPCTVLSRPNARETEKLKNTLLQFAKTKQFPLIPRFTLTQEVYRPPERKEGFFASLLLRPAVAFPVFFLFAALVFFVAFGENMLGDRLKSLCERAVNRLALFVSSKLENPTVKNMVKDGFFGGVGSVASFLPQLALVWLFLGALEESGIASRLAYAADGLLEKVGLSGRTFFAVLLGYSCTAAALPATRTAGEFSERKRAVACLYFLPCSAKLPVYLTLVSAVFENAFLAVCLFYLLSTGMGLAAAAFLGGDEPSVLLEIADICIPSPVLVVKKLLFQLKGFIIKVSTTVLAFTLIVWGLSSFGFTGVCSLENSFLAKLCGVLRYAFYPMGITDWRYAFAAVGGLIAKENIVGSLGVLFPDGFLLNAPSACAFLTFLTLMPPCISAISACARELGAKRAWKYALVQTSFAFCCAYAVRWLFVLGL